MAGTNDSGAHWQEGGRPAGQFWRELARRVERGDTYVLVALLVFITYFFFSLLPEATWSRLLLEVTAGATLLITLRTSKARFRLQRIARSVVAAGFVLTLVGSQVDGLLALVYLVFVALLVVTPFVILNRILRHPSISTETIAGAVDVYIILGLVFSALYRAIAAISGTSFFVQTQHPSTNQYLYFSFASLTTVGYGDLTPATNFGRSFVVLEPLLGQIFLVTIVARLVSAWRPRGPSD
jgi:hypothetical protein